MTHQNASSDSASQGPEPSPVPPPATRQDDSSDERKPSMYLILGLNVVLLALAIWYVKYKLDNPSSDDASADVAGDGLDGTSGEGGATRGGSGDPNGLDAPAAPRATGSVTGQLPGGVPQPASSGGFGGAFDRSDLLSAPTPNTIDGRPKKRGSVPDLTRFTAVQQEEILATDAALQRLGLDLEILLAMNGEYPSSAMDYGSNRGIERLVELLDAAGRLDLGGLTTGDTDGDGRAEILDPWGSPLIYFSADDYDNAQSTALGGGTAEFAAALRPDRGFRAERRFQLWSAGIDGKNGYGMGDADDITSWGINER